MAARDGMANLITQLRLLANAGPTDHTVNGVAYWTDDQLQERLDAHRQTVKRLAIHAEPEYIDGDYLYTEYFIPEQHRQFEEAGTDSGWALRDGDGTAITTGYTVNYESGTITFDADQDAEIYYLDFRVYDMNLAAADVWERKAGFYEASVDWSSDNHSVKRGQQRDFALKKAAEFRRRAGPMVSRRVRTDVNPMRRR